MTNQKRYRRSQRSEKRRYMCLFLVLALLLCAELAVAWHMDRTKKEAAAQQASEIAQQEVKWLAWWFSESVIHQVRDGSRSASASLERARTQVHIVRRIRSWVAGSSRPAVRWPAGP